MAKLNLSKTLSPTFRAKVLVPVAGQTAESIEFTFRRRSKEQFQEWGKSLEGMSDVEVIQSCATGWELEEAFDEDSIGLLCEIYIGAAKAVLEKYITEQTGAKLGN